jgi:hypothetical protein
MSVILAPSNALRIALDGKGLYSTGYMYDDLARLSVFHIEVLRCFAGGRTLEDALAQLDSTLGITNDEFRTMVTVLQEHKILREKGANIVVDGMFGDPLAHYAMLSDQIRVMGYKSAIQAHCRDKVVVEVGCGSGLLSVFAAKAGAKKVYAIEGAPVAKLAAKIIEANGCEDVVTLIRGNSHDIELPERGDVLIHELLASGDGFAENVLMHVADARKRHLKENATLLPTKIEVFVIPVETPPPNHIRPARTRDLAATYGINLDPLVDALDSAPAVRLRHIMGWHDAMNPATEGVGGRALAEPTMVFAADFRAPPPSDFVQHTPVRITHSGQFTAFLRYFRVWFDDENCLTTSPYAPPTCWGCVVEDLRTPRYLEQGTTITLAASVFSHRGKDKTSITVVD